MGLNHSMLEKDRKTLTEKFEEHENVIKLEKAIMKCLLKTQDCTSPPAKVYRQSCVFGRQCDLCFRKN